MQESLLLFLCLVTVATCEWSRARACVPVSNTSSPFVQVYPPVKEVAEEIVVPLYAGLMSATGEDPIGPSHIVSAVQVALDAINHLPNILDEYRLHFTLSQSQCVQKKTVGDLFKQLFQPPGNPASLGLISSRCPEANELSGNILTYYNVSQITCVPSLSEDFEVKPHPYFQVFPSDKEISMAMVAIVTQYGWNRIASIVEDSYRFKGISKLFRELVEPQNISYSEVVVPSSNGFLDFDKNPVFPTESNFRIFIVAMSPRFARQVFCKAHHLDMKYPRYLFLTFSSYDEPVLDEDVDHYCNPDQRAEVLHHSLVILNSHTLIENADVNAPLGTVVEEYYKNYTQTVSCAAVNSSTADAEFAPYCYDATWVLALALNKTVSDLKSNGQVRIEDFVYSNHLLAERIQHHIQETDFNGVTGHVQFDRKGIRIRDGLRVLQYRTCARNDTCEARNMFGSLVQVEFGSFARGQFQYVNNESNTTVWPEHFPYDGEDWKEIATVAVPLVVIYDLLATAGIAFTAACFAFNFFFRHKKIVRLTSPNLNYLILAGAFLWYINTYTYFIPSKNSVFALICSSQILIVSTANTLIMGTIVAKLWRIYYIFRNPHSTRKHTISDWHLMMIVFVLVLLVLGVTLISLAVEGGVSHFQGTLQPNQEMPFGLVGEQEIYTYFYIYSCSTSAPAIRTVTLVLVYINFVGLQFIALFLAFKTRKVKIKGLNDAKHITAVVFLTSINTVIVMTLSFTVRHYVNTFPATFVGLSTFTVTVILILVFIPKMVSLYKDPEGKHVFSCVEEEVQMSTVFDNKTRCKDCRILQRKVSQLENLCNTQKDQGSVFDNLHLRRSCPLLVSEVPVSVSLSVSSNADSASLTPSSINRHVSYVSDRSISLSGFGDSIQLGERV